MAYLLMPRRIDIGDPTPKQIERGKRFGLWVRQAQSRINITSKEAVKRCDVSPSYYGILRNDCYDKVNNRIKRPSEKIITRIAEGLSTDLTEGLKAMGWIPDDTALYLSLPSGRRASIITADGSPITLSDESLRRIDFEIALDTEIAERRKQNSDVGNSRLTTHAN